MADMMDIQRAHIQIRISGNHSTVWINDHEKCLFRCTNIETLIVEDKKETVVGVCDACGSDMTDKQQLFTVGGKPKYHADCKGIKK